jgi:hypothetical protein
MQDTKSENESIRRRQLGAARRRGKEAGVKAASSRTETDYEAGDVDELASAVAKPMAGQATQRSPGVSVTGKVRGCAAKVTSLTPGRPARQAVDRASGRPAPTLVTVTAGGQESAAVVVARETSREYVITSSGVRRKPWRVLRTREGPN